MKTKVINNQRGLATIEAVILTIVFIVLTSFGLGFFGVIHTGIVNSISARQYAFNTFNNRSNLTYHRNELGTDPLQNPKYTPFGFRLHTITDESDSALYITPARNISVTQSINQKLAKDKPGNHETTELTYDHNTKIKSDDGIKLVWIRTAYGICLNADCGGLSKGGDI